MAYATLGEQIGAEYDAWFKQLQALTDAALDPKDWTGRWYDGYTPAEALADGPDKD
jgi:hypothetical protein